MPTVKIKVFFPSSSILDEMVKLICYSTCYLFRHLYANHLIGFRHTTILQAIRSTYTFSAFTPINVSLQLTPLWLVRMYSTGTCDYSIGSYPKTTVTLLHSSVCTCPIKLISITSVKSCSVMSYILQEDPYHPQI